MNGRPKPVSDELVEKLNSVRLLHGADREAALQQLEFTSQRVKNSDPSAYLFLSAGIAAMRDDLPAIDRARDVLRSNFPSNAISHGNIAKAYLSIRHEGRVVDQLSYMLDEMDLPVDVNEMLSLLIPFGRVDEIARYLEACPGDDSNSDRKMLLSLVRSIPEHGVDPADFKRVYDACADFLKEKGWSSPVNAVDSAPERAEYGMPLISLKFGIEVEPEEMLELEDQMITAVLAKRIDAFSKGHVNVSMGYF